MKKHCLILILLLMFLCVGFISANVKANSITIATFADPSEDSGNPLFKVDFINMKLTGGWLDDQNGLTLQIPCSDYTVENGTAFENVWFEMTDVTITPFSTPWGTFGYTDHGVINFYEDGSSTNPLVVIEFDSGLVWRQSFGADEAFVAENVVITGSKITDILSQEQFSFGFANRAKLPGHADWNDGFTATASFTSSAAPEPATIAMLSIGALAFIGRKR